MPDTRAAGVSIAGYKQFKALEKINPLVIIDKSTKG